MEQRRDRDFYFDQSGNEIHEGDLLRVNHFIGRRKRRYYMYHVAILQDWDGIKWWAGKDYNRHDGKGHYNFRGVAKDGILHGTQIINRAKWDEDFKTKSKH